MNRVVSADDMAPQILVEPQPTGEVVLVTEQKLEQVVLAGVRGRPGDSAFEQWLTLHPGGTWDEFMAELGDGSVWQTTEW